MALTDTFHSLNLAALGRAVAYGLAIVLPVTALSVWFINQGDDTSPAWALVGLVAVLAGFAFAGVQVAKAPIELPYTHGALAGLITFALAQAIVLAISAAVGREGEIHFAAITANAFLAASAGMLAAIITSRFNRNAKRKTGI